MPRPFLPCTVALALVPLGAAWWRPQLPRAQVNCHNGPMFAHRTVPVRPGDPRGVAVYAYRAGAPTEAKQQWSF